MRAADHLVDLGPGAGEHGGELVAEGTPERRDAHGGLAHRPVPGRRREEIPVPKKRRRPTGYIEIEGASQHNLRDIDVKVPLGVFCTVTGVSGSGKSTLVNEVLYKAVANRLHRAKQRPGSAPAHPRPRPGRQDHQHRPVADRAHAALQPGHLHRACSTTSASSTRAPRRPGRAATSRAASRSTSRAGAARSAAATARSRSRCTSCRTSTCRASSATASATTARRSRCASRARRSPTCST